MRMWLRQLLHMIQSCMKHRWLSAIRRPMLRPMAGWAVCKPMVVCCRPILRKWTMILLAW
nr:MAG TPA: hypothetical protein [Caudoviricetes sp.]